MDSGEVNHSRTNIKSSTSSVSNTDVVQKDDNISESDKVLLKKSYKDFDAKQRT